MRVSNNITTCTIYYISPPYTAELFSVDFLRRLGQISNPELVRRNPPTIRIFLCQALKRLLLLLDQQSARYLRSGHMFYFSCL